MRNGLNGGLARGWEWLERHPRRALAICIAFSLALKLPFVGMPLSSDEGGFLMVAGQWDGKGNSLYTDQWVDRPPMLLLVFKLADILGGSTAVLRVLSMLLGAIIVAALWWAGHIVNGSRGAVAAAAIAAVMTANFSIDGYLLTGETIAATFTAISCALALEARFGRRARPLPSTLAFLAGVAASLAFLSKQNFIDAGIFGAVLLIARPQRTWRMLIAGAIGVAVPLIATVGWALSPNGPGLNRLMVATFRFRTRSLDVIEDGRLATPLMRLALLGLLFLVLGLAVLAGQLVYAARKAHHSKGLRTALVAMLAYDVVSIMVGASWWSHYLLQLIVPLSLGAALATRLTWRRAARFAPATYAALATVVVAGYGIWLSAAGHAPGRTEAIVASYLKSASAPGDSIVLAYGSPNVIEASGLTTPYRYSWSLPIRTRDPKLKYLVGALEGPSAPTWLVEIGDFDWWGLDNANFEAVRTQRYHKVVSVCGHALYLLDGVTRDLPPTPSC